MKKQLFILAAALVWSASVSAGVVAPSHQAKEIPCEACHTTMPQADFNKCLMCHGGKEKLSKSNSQHGVLKSDQPVPCTVCHKGHQDR